MSLYVHVYVSVYCCWMKCHDLNRCGHGLEDLNLEQYFVVWAAPYEVVGLYDDWPIPVIYSNVSHVVNLLLLYINFSHRPVMANYWDGISCHDMNNASDGEQRQQLF